jgi:Uma2 family endonuclease
MAISSVKTRRWTRREYDRLIDLGFLHEDEKVELLGGQIIDRRAPPRTRRWSRLEYERLIEKGFFQPDERLELISGELVVREPQATPHATAIRLVTRALHRILGDDWNIDVQLPVAIHDESEPEPDVAVVPGGPRDYLTSHPGRPALLVEVAESSLAFDREQKGSLYARANVPEYWIINLVDRVLEVYREPGADPAAPYGWCYHALLRLGPADWVSPLAVPGARIPVADLLP